MLARVLIAAFVLYFLALIGVAISPRHHAPFASPTTAAVNLSSPTQLPDPLLGYAINFHHTTDLSLYLKAVDEIAALGFNSLEIVTPAFQENGASQTIRIEHGPGLSPTREDLVELLLYARSKGMSTTLMPIVLFTKPRGNEWRGKITPEQWGPWWNSYQNMINYFVGIAVESDVQLFCIGSELLTTETDFDQWARIIKHVRARYKGKLIYSTNWDHYHKPTFWSQVDYIGISGYWDLTTLSPADNPGDPDSMARRWIEIRKRLLTFSNVQKRPIILTEIGYPTLPWALKSPWNYVAAGPKAKADPLAQAAGYRAFLAAWEDLLPSPGQRRSPQIDTNDLMPPFEATSQPDGQPDGQPDSQPVSQTDSQPVTQPRVFDALVPELLASRYTSDEMSEGTTPPGLPAAASQSQSVSSQGDSADQPPSRREGFLGFYFYAWDVYHQGGPNDTGYGVRNKPSYNVIKQFMQFHGFKPVKPVEQE